MSGGSGGFDTLISGGGDDQLSITIGSGGQFVADGGTGNDLLYLSFSTNSPTMLSLPTLAATGLGLKDVERLVISAYELRDHRITTGEAADSIGLGGGNDIVIAGGGKDDIRRGAGDDELWGGAGDDYLDGGAGSDTLRGEAGNDVLYSAGGSDRLEGGDGDDSLNVGFASGTVERDRTGPPSPSSARPTGTPRLRH